MKDYPIKLGTLLFTMVEPHRGHEVEYNRWYERDHFYAGCMIGAWQFAGKRFVCTRDLKALRVPEQSEITGGDNTRGSYVALYWVLDGHHEEWNRWAVDQVNWLHANGRMFPERDHVHTLLYRYAWKIQRDEAGVTPELALDHPFASMASVVVDAAAGGSRGTLHDWLAGPDGFGDLAGSSTALVMACEPMPLLSDAPGDVGRAAAPEDRLMLLAFSEAEPAQLGAEVQALRERLEASGRGRLVFGSPWRPTLVGTDTYADELW